MNELRVGILGFGTVGLGTARLLTSHQELLAERIGIPLRLVRIATRTPKRHPDVVLEGVEITNDLQQVVAAPDIDVVVEVIGGLEPAHTLIKTALNHGKHVVTANKALIAEHGNELLQLAVQLKKELLFEASVAGAIPIVKALRESLAANTITRLYGILNGTCNYILTEMRQKGLPFHQVLKTAQEMGYAEADPSFDVDGFDAAHKLSILAAIAFGTPMLFDKMSIEGIRNVSEVDIAWANEMGYRIKLLTIAKSSEQGLELRVQPTMVPATSMVAAVEGVFNAVFVHGDFSGTTMYYGRGAGEKPTASAVVADLIDLARTLKSGACNRVPPLSTLMSHLHHPTVRGIGELSGEYYLRMGVVDRPGVLADITAVLRDHAISIKAIHQKGRSAVETVPVPLVIVTHETSEERIQASLTAINAMDAVREPPQLIRIEEIPS